MFESDALTAKYPSAKKRVDVETLKHWPKKVSAWMRKEARAAHDELMLVRDLEAKHRQELQEDCERYRAELRANIPNSVRDFTLETLGPRVTGIRILVELKGSALEVADKIKTILALDK